MGLSANAASSPLQIGKLVKVWQKNFRESNTAYSLLPHQQRNLFFRFSRFHKILTAQPRRLRRRLTRKARHTLADIACMLALGIALPSEAATLLVNTNTPDVNPDGLCSLIEAIDNSNADAQLHADCPAGSGIDVIQLQHGSVHNITSALGGLPAKGLPAISGPLEIEGNNATLNVAAIPVDRVIDVAATGDLTLSDATISGDAGSGSFSNAPRIQNAGSLRLVNVTIPMEENRVAGITNLGTLTANQLLIDGPDNPMLGGYEHNGNGILNEGDMTLIDSEVRDLNTSYASQDFGSVINRGNLSLEQSSVTGNSSLRGYAIPGIDNIGTINASGLTVSRNYAGVSPWSGITNRAGATLNLKDSLIENSFVYRGYGGLLNQGLAELQRVTVAGNETGLYNDQDAYMVLVDSSISDNVYNQGEMVLTGVTLAGSTGSYAASYNSYAGLFNGGDITITNSTISNNRASIFYKSFSGVSNQGRMTITSSTIAGNSNPYYTESPSLLNKAGGILALSQTVITGQFIDDGTATTVGRVLTNEGTILKSEHNLFGDSSLTAVEAFSGFTPGPTDVVATSDGTQPAPLGDILELRTVTSASGWVRTEADIKDNGGPTETVALVPASPALDAAGASCLPTDQRGVTRPQGAACDIGAFEATPSFPPVVQLSDLDGSNGFLINGVADGDVTGRSVSDAGDVNGDGIADLLLGAPEANQDEDDEARGVGYVVFGRDTASEGGFPASIELSALDGSDGFALDGAAYGDQAGNAVSGAGDLNGDGIDDLVIASPGSAWSSVVFGRDTAVDGNFPARVSLGPGSLDGGNGFRIEGSSATSVSSAGDVNGDGLADLLIGAEDASPNGEESGAGYVVFGRDTATDGNFPAVFELSDLDGSNGFVIKGVAAGDHTGRSVSNAGDINHDGVADVLVGATGVDANGEDSGAGYVVFGKNTASEGDFPGSLELSSLNGSSGFVLNGVNAGDAAGTTVSDAGDINGDGIDDLLIGAPDADPNGDRSGSSYVVFGRDSATDGDFPAHIELSVLDGSNGFTLNGEGVRSSGDRAGFSLSGTGDVNDDVLSDMLIGAPGANRSYVVFGRDTQNEGRFPATVELSALDGSNGFAVYGVNAGDGAGRVSGAGDTNHDGVADLLIGAPGADPNGDRSGAGYVVFGLTSDDADKDGIADHSDNCILRANGPLAPDAGGHSQRDTDSDGYGNVCDPDFNNSGNVDFADLAYLKSVFFTPDADADLNGDGKVDFADLAIQKSMFFSPPGPSGLVP